MDSVNQVVLPGAGYDLIAKKYTENTSVRVFELDQEKTIRLNIETLDLILQKKHSFYGKVCLFT